MLPAASREGAARFPVAAEKYSGQGERCTMDAIDRILLEQLVKDSRQPLKQLAAAVSLSPSSVHDRIARMQSAGIIRRFTIETSELQDRLGAVLHLKLTRTPDYSVVGAVVAMPEVVRCYALAGDIDLMAELSCATTQELNTARDRIAAIAGVKSVTTFLILAREKAPISGDAGRPGSDP